MKTTLLLTYLIIFTGLAACSQSLSITAVDGSNDELYEMAAKKGLGKSMVLKVYDNSVILTIGNLSPINLKVISENTYIKTVDKTNEVENYTLRVTKTLSFITSAVLKLEISEKGGQYRRAWYSMSGKRY